MIHLSPEQHVFVTERHLATLSTVRADGSPHVVPVGFTWDPDQGLLRITTREGSRKVRNIEAWTAEMKGKGIDGKPARVESVQHVTGDPVATSQTTLPTETAPLPRAEHRVADRRGTGPVGGAGP